MAVRQRTRAPQTTCQKKLGGSAKEGSHDVKNTRNQETKKPKKDKKTKIAHTKEDEKRATDLGSDIFFVFFVFLFFWFFGFLVSWSCFVFLWCKFLFFSWCLSFCLHGLDFTPFLRTLVVPCSEI